MENSLYLSVSGDLVTKIVNDINSNKSPDTEKTPDTENDAPVKEEMSEEAVEPNTEEKNNESVNTPLESEDEEDEEGEEEEEEEEEGEEGEEEEGEEEGKVRYIQAIIVRDQNIDIPFPIRWGVTLLILVYSLKLFFILFHMTGCNCNCS